MILCSNLSSGFSFLTGDSATKATDAEIETKETEKEHDSPSASASASDKKDQSGSPAADPPAQKAVHDSEAGVSEQALALVAFNRSQAEANNGGQDTSPAAQQAFNGKIDGKCGGETSDGAAGMGDGNCQTFPQEAHVKEESEQKSASVIDVQHVNGASPVKKEPDGPDQQSGDSDAGMEEAEGGSQEKENEKSGGVGTCMGDSADPRHQVDPAADDADADAMDVGIELGALPDDALFNLRKLAHDPHLVPNHWVSLD